MEGQTETVIQMELVTDIIEYENIGQNSVE